MFLSLIPNLDTVEIERKHGELGLGSHSLPGRPARPSGDFILWPGLSLSLVLGRQPSSQLAPGAGRTQRTQPSLSASPPPLDELLTAAASSAHGAEATLTHAVAPETPESLPHRLTGAAKCFTQQQPPLEGLHFTSWVKHTLQIWEHVLMEGLGLRSCESYSPVILQMDSQGKWENPRALGEFKLSFHWGFNKWMHTSG